MWEQIRTNKRNSFLLLFCMALLLAGIGFAVMEVYAPGYGGVGALLALLLWLFLAFLAFFGGANLLSLVSRGRKLERQDAPQLFNIVEEMSIASGMPMPQVYLIDADAPNAFAAGRDPQHALVAVTSGLLKRLNRDELQGVIAHELAHIANRDVMYVTLAGILVGSIVLISDFFRYAFIFGGGRRSDRREGGAQGIVMIVALVLAILGPIFARLLYFALSRRREYLADACGAQFTRYPEGLASALEKISRDKSPLKVANSVTAPMYIINPLQKARREASSLASTHPPLEERIRILRSMGGASLADYNQAWRQVTGDEKDVIPGSGLKGEETVAARSATAEDTSAQAKRKQAQDINNLVEKINNYTFLACACGLKMKIPPGMKETSLDCPRCGRHNEVPLAELAALGALGKGK